MYDNNENMDDNIITLLSADGDEVDFLEIAKIAYKGRFYALLQPIELPPSMGEDEALVFEIISADGQDNFSIVLDDEIITGVFKEYDKLFDAMNDN